MDRFVKNFIAMSMVYLALASVLGVMMLVHPPYLATYKFVHSHFMLLGWVSMMIYGVGYHILPRFAGRLLKHRTMAEVQFWTANTGLVGMGIFSVLIQRASEVPTYYRGLLGVFGAVTVLSTFLFFYNMLVTVFGKQPEEG